MDATRWAHILEPLTSGTSGGNVKQVEYRRKM